ncbi:MAG: chemotaxis protein CheA [Candidatus Bathyarchaeia archaeon]|jgi:two-component system chemotaxis sensor kinase CheA
MSVDVDQYKQLFIEEAKEHVEVLTKSLLILEKDPKNIDVLNMLFRSAHTLKGSSAMMGYKDFSELTHAMEDIFDAMRRGSQPSSDLVSILLECVDVLTSRLNRIQENQDGEIEVVQFAQRLHQASDRAESGSSHAESPAAENLMSCKASNDLNEDEKKAIREAVRDGDRCFIVDIKFSDDCVFKSVRAKMVLDNLSEKGKIVKTIPSKEELDEEKIESGLRVVFLGNISEKEAEACAKSVCEVDQAGVVCLNVDLLGQQEIKAKNEAHGETKSVADTRSAQTVRVHFDQLDKLMNLVGELVINKIELNQISTEGQNQALKRVVGSINMLTADLHDLVMQIRMVPVSQVFDRFPRLVRDLSLKKEKKADLLMEGREIEVDRTVLDEIGQPLIHLIRNSIDHGIENPDERIKCGKNATGIVRLTAQRKGEHVIIEIADDGAGIDPEKVKKAAVEKGFIPKAEAEGMTKEQLINLIFLPGLSTAKEVTETSGRGVGMDVVQSKITALGGTVHIETRMGAGTKVTLRLPLTLAIIRALLVRDSNQTFAVPASQVAEVIRVKRTEIQSLGTIEAILLRGQVLPILHLHDLFKLDDGGETEYFQVLVSHGSNENNKVGLAIDSILGHQQILVKALDETLGKSRGLSGATILGNGQVVPVLDVSEFINRKTDGNN